MLDKDYKVPDRGKPSVFVGERQSSVLVLLKKSLRSRVINKSLRKLRGLVKRVEEGGELSVCGNEKMSVGKGKVEWSRMEGCCEIPENGKGS